MRKKSEEKPPKMEPLPGFIETRYVKCGSSSCVCASGKGHGPYHYWIYKQGKRKFKKYIRKADLPVVLARIEERRRRVKEAADAESQWKALYAQVKGLKSSTGK